nr:hypothetical protein [Tanacetum cinerariifolium]
NIKKAMDVFENMKDKCVKTWTTVIAGLALHGVVKSGRWYFNILLSKYRIKPRIERYCCMIDLLGRARCLLEAQEVLKQMPFEPNAAIWGSLLAAFRLYGNVELGENPLGQLVNLEPHNSGNQVCSVYLSKMNSDEVVKILQEFPNTMSNLTQEFPNTRSNLTLTAFDPPVKYDFLDTEWIQKPGILLERYPDERVASIGRSVMPMLSKGFDAQGVANIFVLAYHLKAPGTGFGSYIFNPDQNLPVTKGTPVGDFKDIFDYGMRKHVALEATGDPTREAAVYSYIAASLLRLFTKPTSNYVSSWASIVKSFSKFYDEPMNVALPNPDAYALEKASSRFASGEAEKVTLYRLLYMSNSDESHKKLNFFLYDTHLLHYGMHIVSIIEGLCDFFKYTPESIIIAMSYNLTPNQTKCFACLLKLMDQNDENHQKKLWMYAKLFDETFMYHLQTKPSKILIYAFAEALRSAAPKKTQGDSAHFSICRYHTWKMWGMYGFVDVQASTIGLEKIKESKIPVWANLKNVPSEARTRDGISALATSLGKPLRMDNITAQACQAGRGRAALQGFEWNFMIRRVLKMKLLDCRPQEYSKEGLDSLNVGDRERRDMIRVGNKAKNNKGQENGREETRV